MHRYNMKTERSPTSGVSTGKKSSVHLVFPITVLYTVVYLRQQCAVDNEEVGMILDCIRTPSNQ
jgi:hypothetical protein